MFILFSSMVKCFLQNKKCIHLIITGYSLQVKNSKPPLVSIIVHRWFGYNDLTVFYVLLCVCEFLWFWRWISFGVCDPHGVPGTVKVASLWLLSVLMFSQQPYHGCPQGLHSDGKDWKDGMNLLKCFLFSAELMNNGLIEKIATVYATFAI